MRTLTILLVLGLALAAAAPALAQGGSGYGPGKGAGDAARENRMNASEMRERHQALAQARHAAIDSFHENRTRILDAYHATLQGIKASFLENKTRVLDACRALRNETQGNESAKCVQDGLKPLIEEARAAMKDAREQAQADLREARQAAVGKFHAEKAKVNARYGRASG